MLVNSLNLPNLAAPDLGDALAPGLAAALEVENPPPVAESMIALALTPPCSTRPPVVPAKEWDDARVLRRDRLGGVLHEYVLVGHQFPHLQACCEGEIGPLAPASILRTHPNTTIHLAKCSAALLSAAVPIVVQR